MNKKNHFRVTVQIFWGPATSENATLRHDIFEFGSYIKLAQHRMCSFLFSKSLHPTYCTVVCVQTTSKSTFPVSFFPSLLLLSYGFTSLLLLSCGFTLFMLLSPHVFTSFLLLSFVFHLIYFACSFARVGHPFYSKERSNLCVLLRSL